MLLTLLEIINAKIPESIKERLKEEKKNIENFEN